MGLSRGAQMSEEGCAAMLTQRPLIWRPVRKQDFRDLSEETGPSEGVCWHSLYSLVKKPAEKQGENIALFRGTESGVKLGGMGTLQTCWPGAGVEKWLHKAAAETLPTVDSSSVWMYLTHGVHAGAFVVSSLPRCNSDTFPNHLPSSFPLSERAASRAVVSSWDYSVFMC